ncbi:MAG: glycosyltransferase [Planctomycetales bacterium]|nr:glycosyltransferase [Planctomycetales bacterium]
MSMFLEILAVACLLFAVVPLALIIRNLRLYQGPPKDASQVSSGNLVSILIPARNEERGIAAAVEAALASEGVTVEVVVLDDHSTDRTARIVSALADDDERVRVHESPPLPPGWCGKQHACATLAELARGEVFVYLDADVQVTPHGVARAVAFLQQSKASLVSGIPLQVATTISEQLVIPLIHWVLLGFLPLGRMRHSVHPSYGAGCGQLFVTWADDYRTSGGHAKIRDSLHDGVKLPRAYRAAGLATDLFDATEVATCRMYRSGGEVWKGFEKNAIEGLASPRLIVPTTVLLLAGQVLPLPLLLAASVVPLSFWGKMTLFAAVCAGYAPRVLAALRFQQSWLSVVLHPIGVAVLLLIQWSALLKWLIGRPSHWKDRNYEADRVIADSGM